MRSRCCSTSLLLRAAQRPRSRSRRTTGSGRTHSPSSRRSTPRGSCRCTSRGLPTASARSASGARDSCPTCCSSRAMLARRCASPLWSRAQAAPTRLPPAPTSSRSSSPPWASTRRRATSCRTPRRRTSCASRWQRRTRWLRTQRRRSSSRGRRSLSGTACALAAGATSRCRLSRIRPYPHSLARVCAPTHTRARPALVPALAELLARVHTVPGVQLMSCHACGWFIKGNTTQTVPGTAQEPARDARA
mmetsp:Transcript_29940/g.98588  ORF Transcript_29940/g.98588 Transcript_29940/m.98588 type:complete len:248 (-) Transcript_29940:678-1421(-)